MGTAIGLGGDGRYFNKEAVQVRARAAAPRCSARLCSILLFPGSRRLRTCLEAALATPLPAHLPTHLPAHLPPPTPAAHECRRS